MPKYTFLSGRYSISMTCSNSSIVDLEASVSSGTTKDFGTPKSSSLFVECSSCSLGRSGLVHSRSYQNLGNLSHHSFAAVLPGDSVAGIVVANGIINFLNIYNSLLVARLVLTWFPNAPPAIVSPLSTLCDPYLNIFRGIIPPLGGTLDLSPILAFLVLNAFTSTASALPAELPSTTRRASSDTPPHAPVFNLTTSQKKWMRRLVGNKSKTADGES
ncbi:ylmG homolog protein 2, chloroplastic isoform X2 [Nicotiana tabacum]|uniref:YlmG homolog protein 2, chloroplastic isoform X2 n=1 Tax=Nicotiana tabacum TaxID=4097 RepID=A0AC58UAE0_TOBAC